MTISSTLYCDTCGVANRGEAIFCSRCGKRLHAPVGGTISNTLTGLLVPHHTLKGRYRVLGQIGKGGFGAVYRAEDMYFGQRCVAIKEMSQSSLNPQEVLEATEAFKREALLLARLTHPNLPHIYEQFNDGGRWYLVMDFIDGETLEDYLSKVRIPLEKVLDIGIQLCSVLDYLHTRQPPVIFRDLKPGNIMLTPTGHLYLIDFGIARHFKPGQAKDTTALGSSGYAAPEQYGKAQTTPRADIYGFGATLHQMLSGDDPADSPFHFVPLTPTICPPTLASLIAQMLAMDVNTRPANVKDVKQLLQSVALQMQPVDGQTNPLQTNSGAAIPPGYQAPTTVSKAPKVPQAPPPLPPLPQKNTLCVCRGHSSRVTAVVWAPDGKRVASASYDKNVRIWDAAGGNCLLIYRGHAGRVNALAWSPDGKRIVSASDDRTVQIWDAATGQRLFTYNGHNAPVGAVIYSPDGKRIASAGQDKTVQVWDSANAGRMLTYRGHSNFINSLAWSPDGERIASASDDTTVQVWDSTKERSSNFLTSLLFPSRSPFTYRGHSGRVTSVAWRAMGRRIVSVSKDKTVQTWDELIGKCFFYQRNVFSVNIVTWAPNGRHIAIGNNEKTVQVWDTNTSTCVDTYRGHSSYVTSVAWAPDGTRIASAGVDKTVQVWQVR